MRDEFDIDLEVPRQPTIKSGCRRCGNQSSILCTTDNILPVSVHLGQCHIVGPPWSNQLAEAITPATSRTITCSVF